MADWTANSDFGAMGRREPVVRVAREPAPTRADAPKAERFGAIRPEEFDVPRSASAELADYNAAQDGPLAKARVAVWAGGGIVSLALIAGIGVWGYKLVLREVMGLPVVVAEEGPMRLLPADPEGEVVPQQGLAVNAIPAAGTAAPPSDVLMLAPQTPGLAAEDMEVAQTMAEAGEVMPAAPATVATDAFASAAVATKALAPTEAAPAPVESVAAPAEVSAAPAEVAATTPVEAVAIAPAELAPAAVTPAPAATLTAALLPNDRAMTTEEILAFADQIAAGSTPLTLPATSGATTALAAPTPAAPVEAAVAALIPPEAAPVAQAAVALIASNAPGVAAAIRPPARPAAVPTVATAPTPIPADAAPIEAAPAVEATPAAGPTLTASLPSGTNLIQLGAFDSAEIAASEWERLQSSFGEFLGSKERVIQETQSGGRTLYRLRATGFADRADARRLCAALTAEGADCIPVTVD